MSEFSELVRRLRAEAEKLKAEAVRANFSDDERAPLYREAADAIELLEGRAAEALEHGDLDSLIPF